MGRRKGQQSVHRNPRLLVTVTENQYELLKRLARAEGTAISTQVAELVETVEPVLEKVVEILERTDALRGEAREAKENALGLAMNQLFGALTGAVSELGKVAESMQQAGGVERTGTEG